MLKDYKKIIDKLKNIENLEDFIANGIYDIKTNAKGGNIYYRFYEIFLNYLVIYNDYIKAIIETLENFIIFDYEEIGGKLQEDLEEETKNLIEKIKKYYNIKEN